MSWQAADIPDQTGRVAVVTGGNGGLGLETARELARHGATVIIGARNLDKAAAAEESIRADVPGANLSIIALDLASKDSIDAFADELLAAHEEIHILFNNAGVMAVPERETADGYELQYGTNHLGHFYLTFHLLPSILESGTGRVVNTTSTARFFAGEYDLDNPHSRGNYDPWGAYGISKRANLHFALELDARLLAAGSNVSAYAADPGFSDTDLQSTSAAESGGFSQRFFHRVVPIIGQTAAKGALPQLRAGTDPQAPRGSLYRPRWISAGAPVIGKVGAKLRVPEELSKLWAISEADLGIEFDVPAMVAAA